MACNIIYNEKGKVINVLADNGNNSKLFKDIVALGYDKDSAAKKWALTHTPTFKQWFGKSKMVDTNGEPKIMYHKTSSSSDFSVFNDSEFYFVTPDLEFANSYAHKNSDKIIPLYSNVSNPFDYTNKEHLQVIAESLDKTHIDYKHRLREVSEGNWMAIEGIFRGTDPNETGFDGIFVKERSGETTSKNLGVFNKENLKHATENLGTFSTKKDPSPLLNSIKQKFNLVQKNGNIRNIPYMENVHGIAERIEKGYPGVRAFVLQDVGGDYISLDVTPHLNVDNIYHQVESQELAERDEAVDLAMEQFLRSIGVKLKQVNEIRDKNGNVISVTAKADMVNKLVEYSQGKIGLDTLPEEAAHFMVELLEAEKSPLFESMMNNIQSFGVYQEVMESDIYQELYKGDLNKLKKEAIGKLIAKHIINNIKGDESPISIRRIDSWWDRVKEFIGNIFGKAGSSSYARAAHMMLNATVNDHIDVKRGMGSITGEYYQAETNENTRDVTKSTITKLNEENQNWETKRVGLEEAGLKQPWFVEEGNETERYVGKPGGNYAGQVIKGRVSDEVKRHFWKINRGKITDLSGKQKELRLSNNEMRKTTGTAGHNTMEELVELYGNKKGNRAAILKASIFSAAQVQVLEQGVKDLVAQIKKEQKLIDPEGEVVFRTEQMITNRDQSVGGSIDLLVIFSDNSAGIYDYKFVSPSKAAGYVDKSNRIIEDPFAVKMTTYDIQLSQYKKQLIENYGITQVRQSRIVPIHVRYKTGKDGKLTNNITLLQMGTKYSEFLEQIPVAGELTRFDDINKLINKLLVRKKGVDSQLQTKKYKAGASFEALKAQQAKLTKQLRVLQIDQDLAYVIKSMKEDQNIIKTKLATNNPLLKSGELNPNYLTDNDLNDLLSDLMFYQSLVDIHAFVEEMDTKTKAEYVILRDRLAGFILPAITAVQGKMLERTADKAAERGVQGIKSFNLDVSWATTNFVNLSKQTNPYLRNLYQIMDKLNFNKRKITKAKAEEIQIAQDAFIGKRGIKAFDMLLNEDGSFKSKFSLEFYTRKEAAIKANNVMWFAPKEGNVEIDEEYYNKKYKEFRSGKMKALKGKYGDNQQAINREIKKWELSHDVKHHLSTAAINKGGQYFLKPASKWVSDDYKAIQNDPAAKAFYDLYFKTIQQVEEMYGERLGPNFTAEVHKGFTESAFVNGSFSEAMDSTIENFQVREHDLMYGIRDENTGRLIKQIPKLYIQQLRDKNGNIDSSLKSRDLGKGLLLLFDAALDHQLKSDVLPEIQMMEAILSTNAIEVQSTDVFGDILENTGNMNTEKPEKLYDTYQKFVDAYIYGSSLNASDLRLGRKTSAVKSVLGLKNLHSIAQLGLKTPVAIGAFAAGMIGLEYEASKGTFITRPNLNKARIALLKADPKMRALAEYLDYYQKDDASSRADRLSAQYVTRHMTNDKWFAFLSTADKGIDATVLYATALNFGVDENGLVKRLSLLPEGTKNIVESMEIEQNPVWEGTSTNVSNKAVDRYKVKIEGLSEDGELKMRNIAREMSFKIKGSMSDEDKVLYNQNMFLKLMMHYKSWLPGVAMARFGKQRYSHILETFDEGTWVSFFSNTDMANSMSAAQALDIEVHSMNFATSILKDGFNMMIDIATFGYLNRTKVKTELARARFDTWATNNASNPEFADKLKNEETREEMFNEYVEMKRGNIRAFLMEFRATIALLLLLMGMGGDEDEDGKIDIRQSFAGRKIHNVFNRIFRETAVFTQPQEFLDAGRATGIPMLGLLRQGISLLENTVDETGDLLSGEAPYENRDRQERFYNVFKMTPGLNALSKGIELFPNQKYEKF